MRPAAWALTYLTSRMSVAVANQPIEDAALPPIVPGQWAAWARKGAAEAADEATSAGPTTRRRRRPALPAANG